MLVVAAFCRSVFFTFLIVSSLVQAFSLESRQRPPNTPPTAARTINKRLHDCPFSKKRLAVDGGIFGGRWRCLNRLAQARTFCGYFLLIISPGCEI
jgi:hypothetical protein